MLLALLISTSLDSQPFSTQEEAVKAALTQSIALSKNYEYGGVIFEKDGSYFYTIPVTNSSGFYVSYHITIPDGSKLLGLYHTHPNNTPYSNKYSVADILTANKLGIASYIGVVKSGVMMTYDPTKIRVNVTMKNPTDIADFTPDNQKL